MVQNICTTKTNRLLQLDRMADYFKKGFDLGSKLKSFVIIGCKMFRAKQHLDCFFGCVENTPHSEPTTTRTPVPDCLLELNENIYLTSSYVRYKRYIRYMLVLVGLLCFAEFKTRKLVIEFKKDMKKKKKQKRK